MQCACVARTVHIRETKPSRAIHATGVPAPADLGRRGGGRRRGWLCAAPTHTPTPTPNTYTAEVLHVPRPTPRTLLYPALSRPAVAQIHHSTTWHTTCSARAWLSGATVCDRCGIYSTNSCIAGETYDVDEPGTRARHGMHVRAHKAQHRQCACRAHIRRARRRSGAASWKRSRCCSRHPTPRTQRIQSVCIHIATWNQVDSPSRASIDLHRPI